MAKAYKDTQDVPVHLIISSEEARGLKLYTQNWLSDRIEEPESSRKMRLAIFNALKDAGV